MTQVVLSYTVASYLYKEGKLRIKDALILSHEHKVMFRVKGNLKANKFIETFNH